MPRREHFRLSARLDIDLPANIGLEGHPELAGRMVNVSPGGAAVVLDPLLSVGTRLRVVIVTPTLWDPLVLDAVVVWSRDTRRGGEHGVRFDHHDVARVTTLRELISSNAY